MKKNSTKHVVSKLLLALIAITLTACGNQSTDNSLTQNQSDAVSVASGAVSGESSVVSSDPGQSSASSPEAEEKAVDEDVFTEPEPLPFKDVTILNSASYDMDAFSPVHIDGDIWYKTGSAIESTMYLEIPSSDDRNMLRFLYEYKSDRTFALYLNDSETPFYQTTYHEITADINIHKGPEWINIMPVKWASDTKVLINNGQMIYDIVTGELLTVKFPPFPSQIYEPADNWRYAAVEPWMCDAVSYNEETGKIAYLFKVKCNEPDCDDLCFIYLYDLTEDKWELVWHDRTQFASGFFWQQQMFWKNSNQLIFYFQSVKEDRDPQKECEYFLYDVPSGAVSGYLTVDLDKTFGDMLVLADVYGEFAVFEWQTSKKNVFTTLFNVAEMSPVVTLNGRWRVSNQKRFLVRIDNSPIVIYDLKENKKIYCESSSKRRLSKSNAEEAEENDIFRMYDYSDNSWTSCRKDIEKLEAYY